jgi:hypothetical protein
MGPKKEKIMRARITTGWARIFPEEAPMTVPGSKEE